MADFEQILEHGIRWPYQTSFLNPEPLVQPPRMLASRKATKGVLYSNKMRREVRWDSELERNFFMRLESQRSVLYYQEQPAAITYQAAKGMRPYHPDVLITFIDGRSAMVELKPIPSLFPITDFQKWQALIHNCELMGMGFFIGNSDKSLSAQLDGASDPEVTAALRRIVLKGPTLWEDLKALRERHGQTALAFARAALNIPLTFEKNPFRARQATSSEVETIREVTGWFSLSTPSIGSPGSKRIAACSHTENRHSEQFGPAPNVGKRWTAEEEAFLLQQYELTRDVIEIARKLGRKPNGVIKRLVHLGVVA